MMTDNFDFLSAYMKIKRTYNFYKTNNRILKNWEVTHFSVGLRK